MPEQRRNGVGPAGYELRVEVHWCHECDADRTVQIVQLTGDPEPVAVCAECGAGIALWLTAELVGGGHHGTGHCGTGQPGAARRGAA